MLLLLLVPVKEHSHRLLNLAFTTNINTVNKKRAILTKLQNHHFKLSCFNYHNFYTFFNFSSCSFCCLSRFNLCCLSCSALWLSSRMRRNLAYTALAFTVAWSLVIPFTTFREQNDYIIDFFGSLYKTLFSGIIMKFVLTLQRIRHNCMLACWLWNHTGLSSWKVD